MKTPYSLTQLCAAALLFAAAVPSGLAQAPYPSQQIRIICPFPAGGGTDLTSRLLGEQLHRILGQPVIVDNRTGASGMVGTGAAAKSPADGYTLLVASGEIAVNPHLYPKMAYDWEKDLQPITLLVKVPNVLAVNAANVPVHSVKEFIDWAKAKGGKMNYSSLGNGSSAHLTMELFLAEAGITATHIPFNGSPPAAMAVAQGEADATFMVAPALLAHVQSGKVRLLAVSSVQRPDSLKDLPTLADGGLKNVDSLAWNGLFVPTGTPDAVVQKINADVNAALADAAVKDTLGKQGLTPVGGSVAQFREAVQADTKRWGAIISRIGLKIDQ